MWSIRELADLQKEMKPHGKKHRRAVLNVLKNLATYHAALKAGSLPQQIVRGFIHNEPQGVLALDQKGEEGKGLKQFRLYVYPDVKTNTLFVLKFGDKQSQSQDIKACSDWVVEHLKRQRDELTGETNDNNKQIKNHETPDSGNNIDKKKNSK